MGRFVKGDIVVLNFPFSDLSGAKHRPALVVADLDGDDIILCQITTRTKMDKYAVSLEALDFVDGKLKAESVVRPNKVFTADKSIILYIACKISVEKTERVIKSIVDILTKPVSIFIRKVLPKEAPEFAVNQIACWQASYRGIISDQYLNNMSIDDMTERNRLILSDDSYVCYCMEHNKKMIGRLVISKSRDEDKPDAGEIAAMYLIDAYWGKGYGRQMMDFSIRELKRIGYDEVFIWVLETNGRGRRFYERCGFAFDGTMKEISIDKQHINMRYARSI